VKYPREEDMWQYIGGNKRLPSEFTADWSVGKMTDFLASSMVLVAFPYEAASTYVRGMIIEPLCTISSPK
jgi:hypothetical protein